MLSYPVKHPVQIKLVGLIYSESFQRIKYYLTLVHENQKGDVLKPQFRAFMEFDWLEYLHRLRVDIGGKAWICDSDTLIFLNGCFLGDKYDFLLNVSKHFKTKTYWPLELSFHDVGRQERLKFFKQRLDKSYIFFDISYGDRIGRLVFELYSDLLPGTCNRFMKLCLNHPLKERNESFEGSQIFRICKDGWLQGGNRSIPYKKFNDESYAVSHDRRGVLSLCNDGKNTNGTQFFVTFKPSQWMDGYYVAIGQLLEGYHVLSELEQFRTTYEHPDTPVRIKNCGVLPYGRGLQVRKEFVCKIAKDITEKCHKLSKTIARYRLSSSSIVIKDKFYETRKENQEVDTNFNYLMAKIIGSPATGTLSEQTLSQYMLALILDITSSAVLLHDIPEDKINKADVPSCEYLAERYERDLYSKAFASHDHFQELHSLCSSCDFYGQAKRLKEQISRNELIRTGELLYDDSLKIESDFVKEKSHRKIQIDSEKKNLGDHIVDAVNNIFEKVKKSGSKTGNVETEYGDENSTDPIVEVINELLSDSHEEKKTSSHKKLNEKLKENPELKELIIHFVKSLLQDALTQYKRYKEHERRPSILKMKNEQKDDHGSTSNATKLDENKANPESETENES